MMARVAMASRELGPGEVETRRRQRLLRRFIVGAGVLGAVLGGTIGGVIGASHPDGLGTVAELRIAPWLAIVLALGFLIVLVGVPAYAFRTVDEMKVQRNLRGMTAGCFAVLGSYPVWQMLAAGGMVPQPSAFAVFLICYAAMAVSLGVMKWRDGAFPFQTHREN